MGIVYQPRPNSCIELYVRTRSLLYIFTRHSLLAIIIIINNVFLFYILNTIYVNVILYSSASIYKYLKYVYYYNIIIKWFSVAAGKGSFTFPRVDIDVLYNLGTCRSVIFCLYKQLRVWRQYFQHSHHNPVFNNSYKLQS